jgi:hypothetical protein
VVGPIHPVPLKRLTFNENIGRGFAIRTPHWPNPADDPVEVGGDDVVDIVAVDFVLDEMDVVTVVLGDTEVVVLEHSDPRHE